MNKYIASFFFQLIIWKVLHAILQAFISDGMQCHGSRNQIVDDSSVNHATKPRILRSYIYPVPENVTLPISHLNGKRKLYSVVVFEIKVSRRVFIEQERRYERMQRSLQLL